MATKTLPPRELIHKLLSYDSATGAFIWRWRPVEMFPDERAYKSWNARLAGKTAGAITHKWLRIAIEDIQFGAHRLAWLYVHGEPVPDIIDHANHNQLDNRIANLRAATNSQNKANALAYKNNRLGIKGVYVLPSGRFRAIITCQQKRIHLGYFDTIAEASGAYQDAAIKLFGEFARR